MPGCLTTCYAKLPAVAAREIGGEIVLVPVNKNAAEMESIYTLNGVSAAIWKLVDGKRTVGDIKSAILDEYAVSGEQLEVDLEEFFGQLHSIGAVEIV